MKLKSLSLICDWTLNTVSAAFHVDQPQADQHEPLRQHQQQTLKVAESKTKPAEELQQSSGVSERSRCAKGFDYSSEVDSCYRLTGERTTWRMARQRCRQLDADLAIVDSAQQQRYINMKARSNPGTVNLFTPLTVTDISPSPSQMLPWQNLPFTGESAP